MPGHFRTRCSSSSSWYCRRLPADAVQLREHLRQAVEECRTNKGVRVTEMEF